MSKRISLKLSFCLLVLILAACGSDSSSNSPGAVNPPAEAPASVNAISGIAADGYLQGATVCLDLNNNGRCDDGEPSSITGPGGTFTLDVGDLEANNYPVVVEVTTETVDEDGNVNVPKGYTLRAPAGSHEFVGPLTTLIQARIDQNPALDAEAAAQIVGLQLNVENPAKLYADYVAGATDAELANLHKSAQIVARGFGDVMEAVTGATADLSEADELRAVQVVASKLVLAKLDQVAIAVQTGGDTFDPDAAATSLGMGAEAGALGTAEFSTVAQQITAIDGSVRGGAGAILPSETVYSFEEDGDRNGDALVLFEKFSFGASDVSLADGYNLDIDSLDDLGADDEDGGNAVPFTTPDGELHFAAEDFITATRFSSTVMVNLNGLTFKLDDLALTKIQDHLLRTQTVSFGEGDVMYKIKATYQPTDIAAASAMLISEMAEEDPGYAVGNTVEDLQAYVQTRNSEMPLFDHGLIVGEKTYLKYFEPDGPESTTGKLKGIWRPQGNPVHETITLGTYRIAALENAGDLTGRAYIVMDLLGFAEVSGVWDNLLLINDAHDNHDFDEVLIADGIGSKSTELRFFNRSAMEKIFAAIQE